MRRVALIAMLVVLGCNETPANKPGAAAGSVSSSVATAAPGKGLEDPANDKAVVAAAKPALDCDWGNYGFETKCPALQEWFKADVLNDGAADTTLINFLEDERTQVRWLGAEALSRKGQNYRKDKALAGKVMDAADKATEKQLIGVLAKVVGNVDLRATGTAERVTKMIESHGNVELRRGLTTHTLFRNRDVPGMFELFVKLAKSDPDKKVRKAAATAFWTGTPSGKNEEVCKLWLELANDADADLAGHSAYHCAFTSAGGGCTGQWDDLLSLIEKQAKAGQVRSTFLASALKYFYGQKKASAAQKKRAIAIAKELVKNEGNDAAARGSALEFVGAEDPGGKAFAAKYEDDKAVFVKNAAKRVKAAKPKAGK